MKSQYNNVTIDAATRHETFTPERKAMAWAMLSISGKSAVRRGFAL